MEASNKVTNDNSAVKGSFTQGRGKVTRDAHYLFTYTPIFFFAAHLQNTLSIKQVRAPRDDGSDVNYDESYNEPYDNSAEVFIIDHPPSSTAERRDPVVIQSSDGTSSKRPRSNKRNAAERANEDKMNFLAQKTSQEEHDRGLVHLIRQQLEAEKVNAETNRMNAETNKLKAENEALHLQMLREQVEDNKKRRRRRKRREDEDEDEGSLTLR